MYIILSTLFYHFPLVLQVDLLFSIYHNTLNASINKSEKKLTG